MTQKNVTDLVAQIEMVEGQLKQLKETAATMDTGTGEWLTRAQAAAHTGLSPQTISNYCSSGKWQNIRKDRAGRYLIHRSEI